MNRIRFCAAFGLVVLINTIVFGQSKLAEKNSGASYKLNWEKPRVIKSASGETHQYPFFKEAHYSSEDGVLPRFSKQLPLANGQNFSAEIVDASYEPLSDEEGAMIKSSSKIANQIAIKTNLQTIRKQTYGIVSFIPIRKNNSTGKYEKLVSFNLSIIPTSSQKSIRSVHTYSAHSVLQSGNWYKIGIAADGIYKINVAFLQGLGIDVSSINPQNIRIYGNGGGMLPERSSITRLDDLVENAIVVNDANNNGKFDGNDYVLFYGKGTNTWAYNGGSGCTKYNHTVNLYTDTTYYFINTELGPGKRIQNQASSANSPTNIVNTFDDYAYHENDAVNFIKSGRQWFGEYYDNISTYNFSFSFPNIDATANVSISARLASRDLTGSANYSVSATGQSGGTTINVGGTASDGAYAVIGAGCVTFAPTAAMGSVVTVNVTKQTADALAWLDYIEVNARRQLKMAGNQMQFRDALSVGPGNVAQYNLSSNTNIQIWDITDITNVFNQTINVASNNYQFALPSDNLKQFIAFTGTSYLSPSSVGKVVNQDLHGLSNKEFIIVTHPDFLSEAQQLAAYHESADSIASNVVTTDQIYNEFSSGAKDISAIRDFVKMFYDRAGSNTSLIPKYLLMFGDGSYDNKNRMNNNTDYIPTYESYESFDAAASYVSDDFYGCLDDSEGSMADGVDAVDIGIGRFPVDTKTDATAALNKIMSYKKTNVPSTINTTNSCSSLSCSPYGDWRNWICFLADDEEGDSFIYSSESLASEINGLTKNYNIDKIYMDAYVQEATPGGDRYPAVNDAINKRVDKGCLIFNYTGHGGEAGLAHERVVEVSQINTWSNLCNMPLFFTATCELSRYDDPQRVSAGELMFLSPNGAAIALLTTVRESYEGPNLDLNKAFYSSAFTPVNGKMPRLGDIYQDMKDFAPNNSGSITNGRNFTLLGDPALTLNYPKYNISTDSINNAIVTTAHADTLKALSTITVSGFVRDANNTILTNYNGVLYPTVYDKPQTITTLSNDGALSPATTFKLQKNALYKGKVSVTNGHFRFTFIVPKDIAYRLDTGRISYYAENGNQDANGYYKNIIIGGSNANATADLVGPDTKLYLNDTKFIFGGLTNEKPDLYSTLKDASGINTVGNGIGHDLTAVLDQNTNNSIVLNDYYQADLNSYKSGSIRYPFTNLAEGKHSIKLKVWDVYNNSSEAYTEFVVAKSADLALNHVLNYPNPFTTKTQFFFEENQCCQSLTVMIQIFTVSGKLVKTIDQSVNLEGFRSDPINWDGRDDFGDKIGRGVYIYKIKVKTGDGATAEKYEKLVILN